MADASTTKEILPLAGIAVAAFVFNTSEFMPIALLVDIAADFGIAESQAGTLITAYAWAVCLLSLPLMVAASRFGFRRLMLFLVALFGACQVLSAVAPGYGALMAARIGVACAHAVFWSTHRPGARFQSVRFVFEAASPRARMGGRFRRGHRAHRARRCPGRGAQRVAQGVAYLLRMHRHRVGHEAIPHAHEAPFHPAARRSSV